MTPYLISNCFPRIVESFLHFTLVTIGIFDLDVVQVIQPLHKTTNFKLMPDNLNEMCIYETRKTKKLN